MTVLDLQQAPFAELFSQQSPPAQIELLKELKDDLEKNNPPFSAAAQRATRDIISRALRTWGGYQTDAPFVREAAIILTFYFLVQHAEKFNEDITEALLDLSENTHETNTGTFTLLRLFEAINKKRAALLRKVYNKRKHSCFEELKTQTELAKTEKQEKILCAFKYMDVIKKLNNIIRTTSIPHPLEKVEILSVLSFIYDKNIQHFPGNSDEAAMIFASLYLQGSSTDEKKEILTIAHKELLSDDDPETNTDPTDRWLRKKIAINLIVAAYTACEDQQEKDLLSSKGTPFDLQAIILHQQQQTQKENAILDTYDCLPLMALTIENAPPKILTDYATYWCESLKTLETAHLPTAFDHFLSQLLSLRSNNLSKTTLSEIKKAIEKATKPQQDALSAHFLIINSLLAPKQKSAPHFPRALVRLQALQKNALT